MIPKTGPRNSADEESVAIKPYAMPTRPAAISSPATRDDEDPTRAVGSRNPFSRFDQSTREPQATLKQRQVATPCLGPLSGSRRDG